MKLLDDLLIKAGLPAAVSIEQFTGRGFSHKVYRAALDDNRDVVLRRFRVPRDPEHRRAQFLAQHNAPAPRFFAGNERASLHAFAPGVRLGDLIETNQITPESWRSVGRANARTHAVTFPPCLDGAIRPTEIALRPIDPVAEIHRWLDEAIPGLHLQLPEMVEVLPELRRIVDRAATSLRSPRTALGHGDINMWNILVTDAETILIDWDSPRVRDPAVELALLDKHASLFNGRGLDPAFFDGYGAMAPEPNTSIYRVGVTLAWATSQDWIDFDVDPELSVDLKRRARAWRVMLWDYVARLQQHIARPERL